MHVVIIKPYFSPFEENLRIKIEKIPGLKRLNLDIFSLLKIVYIQTYYFLKFYIHLMVNLLTNQHFFKQ